MDVEQVGLDVRGKFGDSRLNSGKTLHYISIIFRVALCLKTVRISGVSQTSWNEW